MKSFKKRSLDEWLVIRCQQGDSEAFNLLMKNWQQRYYLYALRRLEDKEAARDVTQDCLLSISRDLKKLSDPASFPKWSYTILERRCIDWLRKTIRRRELIQQQETPPEIEVSDNNENALTVKQALAQMDPRLAQILRFHYMETLTIDEIAEIMDVPAGTVKSRLYYARKLMIKIIEK